MKKSFLFLSVVAVFCLSTSAICGNPAVPKNISFQTETLGASKARPRYVNALRTQALRGSAEAQFQLAALYEKGSGTPQNLSEAIHWYTQAANQGSALAQFQLGRIFEEGRGSIKKDLAYALSWYEEAARNGLELAAKKLENMQQSDQ